MLLHTVKFLLSAYCLVLSAGVLHAQVPHFIRYQGTLVDSNNVPLEGNLNLTFRLYGVATGGTALWTETQTAVPVSRGTFNVLLGQMTLLTLPFDKDYWLTTQVGTDAEMSPRQRLTSVPYAYRAEVAERLNQASWFEVDTAGTLTTGLVAYWKLDEPSGSRADVKGGNTLSDSNSVTSKLGKKGDAAQFVKANSQYLSMADNPDLSAGDINFTIAAWVYLDTDPGAFIAVKCCTNSNYEYFLASIGGANSRFRFHVENPPAVAAVNANAFGVPPTGQWIFVVAWHDSVNNTINIQINNGSVDSVAYSAGVLDGTGAFSLGALPPSTDAFNGRIDEVGFWKRVLTAQERADLFNGGSGNTYNPSGSLWIQNGSMISYIMGNVGIGTGSAGNILTVQQHSPTDPIADSWTTYPSDRANKEILRTVNPHGYLERITVCPIYEWRRKPIVSDEEAQQALETRRPSAEAREAKKRELLLEKAKLPKFSQKRVGLSIDDPDVPPEILVFNPDGTKAGIDLLAYLGYLHAALKEAAMKLEELESRLPPSPTHRGNR